MANIRGIGYKSATTWQDFMKMHLVYETILQKVGEGLLFDSLGICFGRLLRHICLIYAAYVYNSLAHLLITLVVD